MISEKQKKYWEAEGVDVTSRPKIPVRVDDTVFGRTTFTPMPYDGRENHDEDSGDSEPDKSQF